MEGLEHSSDGNLPQSEDLCGLCSVNVAELIEEKLIPKLSTDKR